MSIAMSPPGVDGLGEAVGVLRQWQYDGAPMHLHPGDLGWQWRFGAEATARAVPTWRRDGEILAIGLLDGPGLVRVWIALALATTRSWPAGWPPMWHSRSAATCRRGASPSRCDVRERSASCCSIAGGTSTSGWTPLAEPAEDRGVRIEVIGPEQAHVRVAAQRAAFDGSTFTDERWHAMATGSPYADAKCLVAYDDQRAAMAAATVWSAGPCMPGLLEAVGVHRAHRGHGYGTVITVAAAAALRDMGSSSAVVCTPSSNVGAVATYRSAGFQQLPDVRDLHRSSWGAFRASVVRRVAARHVQPRSPSCRSSSVGMGPAVPSRGGQVVDFC